MSQENQRLLNWLNKEKQRDSLELESEKKKFIREIKKVKKDQIIKPLTKLTLWQRIKILVSGL